MDINDGLNTEYDTFEDRVYDLHLELKEYAKERVINLYDKGSIEKLTDYLFTLFEEYCKEDDTWCKVTK